MNAEQDNKEAGNAGVSVCNAIDDSPGVREIIRKSYHELDSKCKRAKTLVQVSKELLSVNQQYCDKYKEFIVSLYEFIAAAEMGDNDLERLLSPKTAMKKGTQQPSQLLKDLSEFLNTLNRVEVSRRRLFELNDQMMNTSVGELEKGVPPATIKEAYEAYERSCKEVDKADLKSAIKKRGAKDDTPRKKHIKVSAELITLLNKEHDEIRASIVSQAFQFVSSQETWYHESHVTLEAVKRTFDVQSTVLNEDRDLVLKQSADKNDLAKVLEKTPSDEGTSEEEEKRAEQTKEERTTSTIATATDSIGTSQDGNLSGSGNINNASSSGSGNGRGEHFHGRKRKERLGIYEGYLLEHKNGNEWKKRYFVLKEEGVLLGYDQDGKTLLHTIDPLLISIKPLPDDDATFEIYSPLFPKMTLCAGSNVTLKKWVALLEKTKADKIEGQNTPSETRIREEGGGKVCGCDRSKLLQALWKCSEGNDKCTDCGVESPEWASLNIGGLYCIKCCGVHRHLGTHYSKMRSTKFDCLEPEMYLLQARVGRHAINSIYQAIESHLPAPEVITDDTREAFIRSKYVDRTFTFTDQHTPPEKHSQLLVEACEGDRIPKMLFHLVYGADVNYADPESGNRPAHAAAAKGHVLVLVFLAANGADFNCRNAAGRTPLHFATEKGFGAAVAMLLKYGADPEIADNSGARPRDVGSAFPKVAALLQPTRDKKGEETILAEFFGDMEKNIAEQGTVPTGLDKTWIPACPKLKLKLPSTSLLP